VALGLAELFLRVEVRLPIDNSETADLSNLNGPSDIELEPGKRTSFYAEGGANVQWFSASAFVETLAFSQSPLDERYQSALQPDTEATMIGAKIGIQF